MDITSFDKCTGCSLCVHSCPTSAIKQRFEQKIAFWYPEVDESKCVKCGKCIALCPQNKVDFHVTQKKIFVAQDTNIDSLKTATSGGAASALAKAFVAKGGIVYGAAFDPAMKLKHIRCVSESDCDRIKGSKYVQSNILEVYSQIEIDIKQNLAVLFIGTPCQCAGIKKVFGNHNNFFCCDFICNGVGSPFAFEQHILYLEKLYRCKIVDYIFRPKKYSYLEPYEMFVDENGKEYHIKSPWKKWGSLYYSALVLRLSCFKCTFARTDTRVGNITFSDIPMALHSSTTFLHDVKRYGGSLISVNDEKGTYLLEICPSLYIDEVDTELIDGCKHCMHDIGERDDFLLKINESFEKGKIRYLGTKCKVKGKIIEFIDYIYRKRG